MNRYGFCRLALLYNSICFIAITTAPIQLIGRLLLTSGGGCASVLTGAGEIKEEIYFSKQISLT